MVVMIFEWLIYEIHQCLGSKCYIKCLFSHYCSPKWVKGQMKKGKKQLKERREIDNWQYYSTFHLYLEMKSREHWQMIIPWKINPSICTNSSHWFIIVIFTSAAFSQGQNQLDGPDNQWYALAVQLSQGMATLHVLTVVDFKVWGPSICLHCI